MICIILYGKISEDDVIAHLVTYLSANKVHYYLRKRDLKPVFMLRYTRKGKLTFLNIEM